jgi:SAM-dependent methyltransferase
VRPPAILSSRIGGAEADYQLIGRAHADWLRESLPQEWDWTGKAVLDFGCGTGRSLTHFEEEAASGEFWGSDIDGDSIDWASANLSPPFRFARNDALPPLPFPDGKFDLVYGFSVFTHLLDSWSAWLLEIHRVLAVGGYGVFTFLGEGMIGDLTGRRWDPDSVGMISLDAGRPWLIGGPNALHSEWWLRSHWGRAFLVEHVEPYRDPTGPRGHGLVVIRKDDRPLPSRQELEDVVAGDPRELRSLQLNVELLLERSARLWQANGSTTDAAAAPAGDDSAAAEIALLRRRLDEMTRSRSWRLTAPLRALRRSLAERRDVG